MTASGAGSGAKEVSDRLNAMVDRLHLRERYDMVAGYIRENPVKAMFIVVAGVTCALPVLGFVGFILMSVLFGVIGLLFIEGTALTIASVSLLFILAGCLITTLGFTASILACFFALRAGKGAFKVACESANNCANQLENKEGPVGQVFKSCRVITTKLQTACGLEQNGLDKNKEEPTDGFEAMEKQD